MYEKSLGRFFPMQKIGSLLVVIATIFWQNARLRAGSYTELIKGTAFKSRCPFSEETLEI